MGKFEDFIDSHRKEFDSLEPSQGHEERFRARLPIPVAKRTVNLTMVAVAASIVGLLFTASLSLLLNLEGVVQTFGRDHLAHEVALKEPARIEQHYNRLLSQKKQYVFSILPTDNAALATEIKAVFEEMDLGRNLLRSDLIQLVDSERKVYIVLQFYQTQMDILDGIIDQIAETNTNERTHKAF